MTEEEIETIKSIAEEFVKQTDTRDPEDAKEFVSKVSRINDIPERPTVWVVVFQQYDKNGFVLDGPFIVYVDKKTMKPRYPNY